MGQVAFGQGRAGQASPVSRSFPLDLGCEVRRSHHRLDAVRKLNVRLAESGESLPK